MCLGSKIAASLRDFLQLGKPLVAIASGEKHEAAKPFDQKADLVGVVVVSPQAKLGIHQLRIQQHRLLEKGLSLLCSGGGLENFLLGCPVLRHEDVRGSQGGENLGIFGREPQLVLSQAYRFIKVVLHGVSSRLAADLELLPPFTECQEEMSAGIGGMAFEVRAKFQLSLHEAPLMQL